MIGLVLAAGTGRRLRPYTDGLPKALVPLGETTPLDLILANYAMVGVTDVAVVVGYAAEAVEKRKADLERLHGVTLELVPNDRAETWNNCYSLWCARDRILGDDVLLSNGDTVHPVSVEVGLLAGEGPEWVDSALVLATDTRKRLGEEEMKLTWSADRGVEQISKLLSPDESYGEYIGVSLLFAELGEVLVDALETTWRRDPHLYYEDAFQEVIDREVLRVGVQDIGDVPWIEIDDHADLANAHDVVAAIAKEQEEPRCLS